MHVEIADSATGEPIEIDLTAMTNISHMQLTKLYHQVVDQKDYEAMIVILRAALRRHSRDLQMRTVDRVRCYFDSLHWYECKFLSTKPEFRIELPFNDSHFYGSLLANVQKIELMSGAELWNKVMASFQDLVVYENGPVEMEMAECLMTWFLDLKYLTKLLPSFTHLQLPEHQKFSNPYMNDPDPLKVPIYDDIDERLDRVSLGWLQEVIDFQRVFLKDYFAEIDTKRFDEEEMAIYKEHFVKGYNYPKGFYQSALTALYRP